MNLKRVHESISENAEESYDHFSRSEETKMIPIEMSAESMKRIQKTSINCRICLQNQLDKGRMIKPCLCNGSIEFVHQKCLGEWILRKIQKENTQKVKCQICLVRFIFQLKKERVVSMKEFCDKYEKHQKEFKKTIFILTLLSFGISIISAMFAQIETDSTFGQYVKQHIIQTQAKKIIWVIVLLVLSIFFVILSGVFFLQNAITTKSYIKEISNYQENYQRKKVKIHPLCKR